MGVKLPRAMRGTRPSAADFNALASAVEAALTVRTGQGLAARAGLDGVLLTLLGRQRDRGYWVKITNRTGPNGTPGFPSQFLYDVAAIDRGWTAAGMTPAYGRPAHGDECKIWPAEVGDLAYVLRNPQADGTVVAELWIFNEVTAKGPCTAPLPVLPPVSS